MGPSPRWRTTWYQTRPVVVRPNDYNDLDTNAQQWKYVDDTTLSEVVVKGGESHVQAIANRVIEWSHENRVQLNADKCKELRISFAKEQRVFDPVIIEGKEVELVTSTKLLLRVLRPYNSERSNMERPCN